MNSNKLDLSGINTTLSKGIFNKGFSNASGAHPPEFNLDSYNALTADTSDTPALLARLNQAVADVTTFVKEYQRQTDEHNTLGDPTDAAISSSWRDTTQMALNELTAKRDALAQKLNVSADTSTNTQGNPSGNPSGNPTDNTNNNNNNNNPPVDNTILGMPAGLVYGIAALLVIIGGALAYKKFGKKGAGKSSSTTATA